MSKVRSKNLFTETEEPKRYDFHTNDYLIREDAKIPDVLLYPPWRDQLLIEMGDRDLLMGKALEEYKKLKGEK